MTTQTTQTTKTATIYRVTLRGLEEIADWMRIHYKNEVWDRLTTPDDVIAAVGAWAEQAEHAQHGEIEMPAHWTRSGLIAYLTPEREAVRRAYTYRTDGELGEIDAVDFADACAQLDAMFTPAVIADGGWGWVDDCDDEEPRYEIGGH